MCRWSKTLEAKVPIAFLGIVCFLLHEKDNFLYSETFKTLSWLKKATDAPLVVDGASCMPTHKHLHSLAHSQVSV